MDNFIKLLAISIFVLGGSQAGEAWALKDFALFSQPQKVSHSDAIILGNGQFHNVWVSYGRPFWGSKSGPKSLIQSPEDDFKFMKRAYENVGPLYENIFFFDEKKLFKGQAANKFWSYVNSPTFKGGLALRPRLQGENFKFWPDFRDVFEADPPWRLYSNGETNRLSAASKYDYLFGEENNIYKKEIQRANGVYARFGEIAHWAGICHGTAPASFSYPEPLRPVTVKSHDNKDIHFSVADIKRLAAHIWGENHVKIYQTGKRCGLNILGSRAPECLDTNPATFHLTLLNYMGLYNKTFVVDNAYDSMVWNRPVMSFEYKYKNPINKVPSRELKYSMVKLEDFQDDPHSEHRAEEAVYLVGIQMTVKLLYGDENAASGEMEAAYNINYSYDLEIDKDGKIVGGEWETLYHPDFMWMVKEGVPPSASEDLFVKEDLWDGRASLGKNVKWLGQKAARRGELLEHVIRSLIELSRSKGVNNDYDLQ